MFDNKRLTLQDVIDNVGVDGRFGPLLAGLHVGQEVEQGRQIVALRKTLSAHETTPFQDLVREEEPVRRNQSDVRMARPPRQQRLKHTRRGTFPGRDAAREPDDERHLAIALSQKLFRDAMQPLGGLHIEIEQTA